MGPQRLDPAAERAFALAFALAGFVLAAGVMTDNSLLTHLATGRLILDTGSVPSVDPYSRFGAGEPWTVQSWLVSLVYASADRLAGPPAIRLFNGVVGALIGIGAWRLGGPAGRVGTRVGLAAAPLAVGFGLWSPRPLLVGLAALVGLLLIVRERRAPWLLVPLLWVWGNAHGSFPLALAFLTMTVLGGWLDDRRLDRRDLGLLAWAAIGTAGAAVGPLGLDLLAFPLEVLADREAMTGVVEWEAPTYATPGEWAWLGSTPLLLLAARRGGRWRDLLPAVAFVLAASLALRNVAPGRHRGRGGGCPRAWPWSRRSGGRAPAVADGPTATAPADPVGRRRVGGGPGRRRRCRGDDPGPRPAALSGRSWSMSSRRPGWSRPTARSSSTARRSATT